MVGVVWCGRPLSDARRACRRRDDLASRLCQLEDMRTLQFSTRALIPDSVSATCDCRSASYWMARCLLVEAANCEIQSHGVVVLFRDGYAARPC